MRAARLMLLGTLVVGCGGAAPAATPLVIYVTQPPATPTLAAPSQSPTPTAEETPISHTMSVEVTVYDNKLDGLLLSYPDQTCTTTGLYSDIGPGMQATVKDPSGTILGLTTFEGHGVIEDSIGSHVTQCWFNVAVKNLPDEPFYSVDLGRRGSVQFSKDELASTNWVAGISIGQN